MSHRYSRRSGSYKTYGVTFDLRSTSVSYFTCLYPIDRSLGTYSATTSDYSLDFLDVLTEHTDVLERGYSSIHKK